MIKRVYWRGFGIGLLVLTLAMLVILVGCGEAKDKVAAEGTSAAKNAKPDTRSETAPKPAGQPKVLLPPLTPYTPNPILALPPAQRAQACKTLYAVTDFIQPSGKQPERSMYTSDQLLAYRGIDLYNDGKPDLVFKPQVYSGSHYVTYQYPHEDSLFVIHNDISDWYWLDANNIQSTYSPNETRLVDIKWKFTSTKELFPHDPNSSEKKVEIENVFFYKVFEDLAILNPDFDPDHQLASPIDMPYSEYRKKELVEGQRVSPRDVRIHYIQKYLVNAGFISDYGNVREKYNIKQKQFDDWFQGGSRQLSFFTHDGMTYMRLKVLDLPVKYWGLDSVQFDTENPDAIVADDTVVFDMILQLHQIRQGDGRSTGVELVCVNFNGEGL